MVWANGMDRPYLRCAVTGTSQKLIFAYCGQTSMVFPLTKRETQHPESTAGNETLVKATEFGSLGNLTAACLLSQPLGFWVPSGISFSGSASIQTQDVIPYVTDPEKYSMYSCFLDPQSTSP